MNVVILLCCPDWMSIEHIPRDLRIITFGKELITTPNYKQIKCLSYNMIEVIYQLYLVLASEQHPNFTVYAEIPIAYQILLSNIKPVVFKSPTDCFFSDYLKLIHPTDRDLYELCCDFIVNNNCKIDQLPFKAVIADSLDLSCIRCLLDYRSFMKYTNKAEYFLKPHEVDIPCYLSPVNTTYTARLFEFMCLFRNKKIKFTSIQEATDVNRYKFYKYQTTISFGTLSVTSSDHYYLLRHSLESASKSMCHLLVHLIAMKSTLFEFNNHQEASKVMSLLSPFDDFHQSFKFKLGYICDRSKLMFQGSRLVIEKVEHGYKMPGRIQQIGKSIDGLLQASMLKMHKTRFTNGKNLLFDNYYAFFDYYPDNIHDALKDIQVVLYRDLKNKQFINCQFMDERQQLVDIPFKFLFEYDALRFVLLWCKPEIVTTAFKNTEPWKRRNRAAELPNIFMRSGQNYNSLKYAVDKLFSANQVNYAKFDKLFEIES